MAADDDDKTEEPTQKRIDDALKRGEIVYSAEVGAAFSLFAATLIVAFMAAPMANELGQALRGALSNAHELPADGHGLMKLYGMLGLKIFGIPRRLLDFSRRISYSLLQQDSEDLVFQAQFKCGPW